MWSLSGAFTKALTTPTVFDVNEPPIESLEVAGHAVPVQLAFYRAFFAGLVLVPTLRRGDLQIKPMMFAMLACFALMNAAFLTAQSLGTAANAILLQNSAPLWMYLVSVYWLGEPSAGAARSVVVGMIGIGIIVGGAGTAAS